LVRSALSRLDSLDWDAVDAMMADMRAEAAEALAEAGTPPEAARLKLGADLRYTGQQNEVGVTFEGDPIKARDALAIRKVFEDAYFAQYGVNPSHVPIEVVSWRLTAQGPEDKIQGAKAPEGAPGQPVREIDSPLWSAAGKAKVYARPTLVRGQTVTGPALVEERETTIVLPPGWTATVDDIGCLVAKRKEP
ncbi:MAG TPA: hypothetical protein VG939_19625, partial [Caulobacteraceae bacterium]|nr:hypothetical protein [Caulobacteraceae bacterium]